MKKFIAEFKEFINKGNVMDLAVGVIIGGAFQTIVNSLVNDLLMPILGAITGGVHFESWKVTLGAGELENPATLTYGNFIAALINFLLMAIVLFLIVKILNRTRSRIESIGSSDKEEETPTTKNSPYCKSEIDIEATRCPHCTSELTK
jgi:large conductance mechanosensitive channel protein